MPTFSENVLWHYTPSNTRPEELEALLVERAPILAELVESVRLAVNGQGVRHFLLVGPRGAGKTHIVSVLRHRIAGDPELRQKIVIGWLPEDMFGMSQPVNWFRTLAEELGKRGEIPEILNSLAGLTTAEERTAESVGRLITSYLGDRLLVILHENLNRVLRQLGRRGQQVIRAFLQNNPNIQLIATTPSLSDDVQKHEAPFYGFFQTRTLDELTYEGTLDLFTRLARLRGDEETVAYLDTPIGKGRVRSVQVLAGSNPRILVVFGGFMSRDGLGSLLPLFEKTIDEMTPYYQERMESLSPQQQEVLLQFLKVGHALTPTEVSERSWLTLKLAGTILGNLSELGFLRRRQHGKRSWYDLREPLMKMAWQVKDARTEPIELIVDFIRVWFTPSEVDDRICLFESGSMPHKILQKALELGFKLDLPSMEGTSELEANIYSKFKEMPAEQRVMACERLIGQKGQTTTERDLVNLAMAYGLAGKEEKLAALIKNTPNAASLVKHLTSMAIGNIIDASKSDNITMIIQGLELIGKDMIPDALLTELLTCGSLYIENPLRQSDAVKTISEINAFSESQEYLSTSLVATVHFLLQSDISLENAESWLASWRQAVGGRDAFLVPFRILDAAVKYKKEPSEVHLLQLPQEERQILASLLPADVPAMRGRKPKKSF